MKVSRRLVALIGLIHLLVLGAPAFGQVVPVGLLSFQDDSGTAAPPELRQRLAQDLQQKLLAYKELLPKMLASDPSHPLTMDELIALGKQNGVPFVLRGGLLALSLEPSESKSRVSVALYVDVISVDGGAVLTTVRGDGAATQAEPLVPIATLDVKDEHFRRSAIGLALAAAFDKIADPLRQALLTPGSTAAPTPAPAPTAVPMEPAPVVPSTDTAPPPPAATTADTDAEIQQLVAQAESILQGGANASADSVRAVSQALNDLNVALSAKADLMQRSADTAQADRDISARKDALQTALTRVMTEVTTSATSTSAPATPETPTGEKKDLLTSIDQAADSALSILQKMQQIRTTLREPAPPGTAPGEPPTGEGSGVITDESGRPVEGAQVTDPATGASATTDSSGVYHLKGLLTGNVANLIVKKGSLTSRGVMEVMRNRPAVLDLQLRQPSSTAAPRPVIVLPSTVFVKAVPDPRVERGVLSGVVRDAGGRPAARAVVTLRGLGVARTNSLGQYTFLNVPAGTHELLINQSGLQTRSMRVEVAAKKSNDVRTQLAAPEKMAPQTRPAIVAPVSSATAPRVPVVVQKKGSIAGQIVDGKTRRPLAGVTISVAGRTAASDSSGRFVLADIAAGAYQVSASKAGYSSDVRTIAVRAGEAATLNVSLTPRAR